MRARMRLLPGALAAALAACGGDPATDPPGLANWVDRTTPGSGSHREPDAQARAATGGPRSPRDPLGTPVGYCGNPFAGMGEETLAALREEARREAEPLLARYRAEPPGQGRAELLKDLAEPLRRLMETGGGLEPLALLAAAAEEGATERERKTAVIAVHRLWQREAVDWLLERTRSRHAEVRFYAFEGLAWVSGSERARAVAGVARGLEDPDAEVRAIAALSLGMVVAEPARAADLLGRLSRETDRGAAEAMADAVLRLDPERGRARVEVVARSAPEAARRAVAEALATRE